MLILTWIRKIYKALSANASPTAIAFGAAFGLTAGCVPLTSGAFLFLFAILLTFKVQISTGIMFWIVGRVLSLAVGEVVFFNLGDALLYSPSLMPFWTWFLNAPLLAWSGFQYPAVLGGFAFGVLFGAVLFVPIRMLVIGYRKFAHEKVSKNKFFKWISNFWLFKLLKWVLTGVTK